MCEIIESCDGHVTRPGFVKRKRTGFKEDPFVFLEESDPIIDEIR